MEHTQIEINSVEDIKTYMISYNERIRDHIYYY